MTMDSERLKQQLESIAADLPRPTTDLLESVRRRRRRRGVAAGMGGLLAAVLAGSGVAVALQHRSGPKAATNQLVPAAGSVVSGPAGFASAVSGGRELSHLPDFAHAVQLDPPGPTLQPVLSAAAAYGLCATANNAECETSPGPTITFALATSDIGGQVQADGSVKSRLTRTPAWILYWSGITCYRVSGGGLAPGQDQSATSGPKPCTKVAVIDATTGTYLYTEQLIPNP
jgi:hypothetical protein